MNNDIENLIRDKHKAETPSVPVIFDLTLEDHQTKLRALFDDGLIRAVSDDFEEELREFFQAKNPSKVYTPEFESLFKEYVANATKEHSLWQLGRWVYYPWLLTLVHVLEEHDFFIVRTARNKNLINADEQDKFYNATIGLAGLSVGSSVALTTVLQGGGKKWKIADFDRLALSNTNRIRAGVQNLGMLKTEVAARQMYEINPYLEIELFSDGLTPDNVGRFFEGLSIVVDEIDNLALKYLIREHAQKNKLAVVMAADNGDNGVVDVERYDLDSNIEFFHGRMGEVNFEMLKNLDKFGIGKMITKHVGPENVTERMQNSLLEMGKTVVSWPQLGGAAQLNGSAVAYCIRKILNGQPVESNRALISLDEKLEPGYNTPEAQAKRDQVADTFRKIFGL